jgi:thiol-disulfide isomerase/thioredoxin
MTQEILPSLYNRILSRFFPSPKPSRIRGLALGVLGLFSLLLPTWGQSATGDQTATLPIEIKNAVQGLSMIPFEDLVESVDFELPNLEGDTLTLKDFSGEFVLLNFWATWCGPCRAEMPSMQALYNDFNVQGFEILAVNQREARNLVKEFIDEFEYTFPVVLDVDGRIGYQYGVRSIPLSYLIDPQGRIIAGKIGAHDWNTTQVRSALSSLIEYHRGVSLQ